VAISLLSLRSKRSVDIERSFPMIVATAAVSAIGILIVLYYLFCTSNAMHEGRGSTDDGTEKNHGYSRVPLDAFDTY